MGLEVPDQLLEVLVDLVILEERAHRPLAPVDPADEGREVGADLVEALADLLVVGQGLP